MDDILDTVNSPLQSEESMYVTRKYDQTKHRSFFLNGFCNDVTKFVIVLLLLVLAGNLSAGGGGGGGGGGRCFKQIQIAKITD